MSVERFRDISNGVTEEVTQMDNCRTPVGPGEAVAITATGTTRNATAFPAGTRSLMVCGTVDCFYETGSPSPTAAVNTSSFIPAGTIFFAPAIPGWKVAVIRAAVDGTFYIRPCN
jgi:hypothetical protein